MKAETVATSPPITIKSCATTCLCSGATARLRAIGSRPCDLPVQFWSARRIRIANGFIRSSRQSQRKAFRGKPSIRMCRTLCVQLKPRPALTVISQGRTTTMRGWLRHFCWARTSSISWGDMCTSRRTIRWQRSSPPNAASRRPSSAAHCTRLLIRTTIRDS